MLSHFFSITDSSAFLVMDSLAFLVTDSLAFTSGKSTNLFLITTPSPQCLHFHPSYLSHPSHPSHLSHLSHIFARAARTLTSPIPLNLLIPPTIARAARTPTIACLTRTSPKNFLFTLTLYLPYTNDTGRANEKRKISEV